jgi:hypothetical protein
MVGSLCPKAVLYKHKYFCETQLSSFLPILGTRILSGALFTGECPVYILTLQLMLITHNNTKSVAVNYLQKFANGGSTLKL